MILDFNCSITTILTIIIGALLIFLTKITFFKKSDEKTKKRKVYPKNIVILHQVERGLRAPSASPFCLKLETWYI